MQAKDIIERARIVLQDAGADYWQTDELPRWLSDARLAAYTARPDLYQAFTTVALNQGARQTLPDQSRHLFAVVRNVSHVRQRHITLTDDAILSRYRPNWRGQKPANQILHYLYDALRGGTYEVFPPAIAGVEIELSYARLPETITAATSTHELHQEGEHAPALVDYILYRAFQKEADTVPTYHDRAAMHLAQFQSALTGSVAVKAATSPTSG